MNESLDTLQQAAERSIADAVDLRALEQCRVEWLGKKGRITEQLKQLAQLTGYEKKAFGEKVNRIKQAVTERIESRQTTLAAAALEARLAAERIDVSLPARGERAGGLHPITRTVQRIERLFNDLGFSTVEGPEIEDDFHDIRLLEEERLECHGVELEHPREREADRGGSDRSDDHDHDRSRVDQRKRVATEKDAEHHRKECDAEPNDGSNIHPYPPSSPAIRRPRQVGNRRFRTTS